jgi:DNA-binding transcriptional LysR family regulator
VRPRIRVNNWLVLAEAAAAGSGLAVLPCHLGDGDPRLRRLGPVLDEIDGSQWLLVHEDLRQLPRVRRVMDALVGLFQAERPRLEGKARPRLS